MTLLCCILLFGLLQVTHATVRGDVNDVSFANFIVHEGSKLCGSPLKKVNLKSLFDCLIECTANTRCLSTNVNTTSDAQGLLECELLGIDKYQHENNSVTKVKGIDHYALPSTCASSPCQNNGTCVPVYANNSYVCECPPLKTGTHCEKDCSGSFGMQDGRILDSMINASSFYNSGFHPYYGRLNKNSRGQGCWQPKFYQPGQYLQIDLSSKKSIHKVATQGRPSGYYSQWITSFTLKYSDDGSTWTNYTVDGAPAKIFTGNVDKNTVKPNVLPAPFMARYVRVVIKTWSGNPSMRVELYGCN